MLLFLLLLLLSVAEFLLFDELLCQINLCLAQCGGREREREGGSSCNGENKLYLQLMSAGVQCGRRILVMVLFAINAHCQTVQAQHIRRSASLI